MFLVSQLALRHLKACDTSSIPSYSIAIGIVLYATVYLYVLFYKPEFIYMFNKFLIYIVSVDLLLATFVHIKNNDADNPDVAISDAEDCDKELQLDNELQLNKELQELDDSDHSDELEELTAEEDNELSTEDNEPYEEKNNLEIPGSEVGMEAESEASMEAESEMEGASVDLDNFIAHLDNSNSNSNPIKRKRGRPSKKQINASVL